MRVLLFCLSVAFAGAVAADIPTIEPKELASQLAKGSKPAIFQVGPNVLFRSKHIPGAIYAGPGSRAEGLDILRTAVDQLPRTQAIVLYCGCCPWEKCPNVKPSVELLQSMGFTNVTTMHVAANFKTDWIDQGYPVEPSAAEK